MPNSTRKSNFIINVEKIIINLLTNDKKFYVDINRLNNLCTFIKEQLIEKKYLSNYESIVFDVNFNAIHRTVMCKDSLFQLVGERIYLKETISDEAIVRCESHELTLLVREFLDSEVA